MPRLGAGAGAGRDARPDARRRPRGGRRCLRGTMGSRGVSSLGPFPTHASTPADRRLPVAARSRTRTSSPRASPRTSTAGSSSEPKGLGSSNTSATLRTRSGSTKSPPTCARSASLGPAALRVSVEGVGGASGSATRTAVRAHRPQAGRGRLPAGVRADLERVGSTELSPVSGRHGVLAESGDLAGVLDVAVRSGARASPCGRFAATLPQPIHSTERNPR